jgi:hypothetical protein
MWLLSEDWARSSVSYVSRPAEVFNWCVLSVLSDLVVLIRMRSRLTKIRRVRALVSVHLPPSFPQCGATTVVVSLTHDPEVRHKAWPVLDASTFFPSLHWS